MLSHPKHEMSARLKVPNYLTLLALFQELTGETIQISSVWKLFLDHGPLSKSQDFIELKKSLKKKEDYSLPVGMIHVFVERPLLQAIFNERIPNDYKLVVITHRYYGSLLEVARILHFFGTLSMHLRADRPYDAQPDLKKIAKDRTRPIMHLERYFERKRNLFIQLPGGKDEKVDIVDIRGDNRGNLYISLCYANDNHKFKMVADEMINRRDLLWSSLITNVILYNNQCW